MRNKLIQIGLGAVGSMIAVMIQYFATATADPAVTIACGSGTSALLGNTVERLLTV